MYCIFVHMAANMPELHLGMVLVFQFLSGLQVLILLGTLTQLDDKMSDIPHHMPPDLDIHICL